MQIKRFEAENMTKALKLVKQEFGSEAVILSARSLEEKKGGVWPVKRHRVEVTAANDTYYPETQKTSSSKIRKFENSGNKKSLIGSLYGGIMALKNKPDKIFQNHAKELADLNQRMLSQDVEENIARKLTEEVNRIASPKKLLKDNELKLCLIRVFKEMGITAGPVRIEPGKQKVVAFIGPTGVGKTTTIAKLAAIHAIKMKKQVALISLDNYRIGSIDQLRIYAKIIGIPIEVASTGKEFKECLNRLKDKDLILIDTAGMSQRNEYQFNELRIFFNKVRRVETHLLLSATTKEDDLIDILARFKVFRINKLLFTKLDESTSYGNILNQLIRSKIPVSYFTNGQQIPEDIEIATLEKLVDLITDQEKDGRHLFVSRETLIDEERKEVVSNSRETLIDEERKEVVFNHHSSEFYVANKNSFFFHCFDCQLAKEIKQEDLIVFERAIDAVNTQLKPCGLCCPDKVEKQSLYPWDADKRKSGTYQ